MRCDDFYCFSSGYFFYVDGVVVALVCGWVESLTGFGIPSECGSVTDEQRLNLTVR